MRLLFIHCSGYFSFIAVASFHSLQWLLFIRLRKLCAIYPLHLTRKFKRQEDRTEIHDSPRLWKSQFFDEIARKWLVLGLFVLRCEEMTARSYNFVGHFKKKLPTKFLFRPTEQIFLPLEFWKCPTKSLAPALNADFFSQNHWLATKKWIVAFLELRKLVPFSALRFNISDCRSELLCYAHW